MRVKCCAESLRERRMHTMRVPGRGSHLGLFSNSMGLTQTIMCRSDRRSVGAWTERAPNLRGREGVNVGQLYLGAI